MVAGVAMCTTTLGAVKDSISAAPTPKSIDGCARVCWAGPGTAARLDMKTSAFAARQRWTESTTPRITTTTTARLRVCRAIDARRVTKATMQRGTKRQGLHMLRNGYRRWQRLGSSGATISADTAMPAARSRDVQVAPQNASGAPRLRRRDSNELR